MAQAYSRPSRENDPHALPDVEVFQVGRSNIAPRIGDGCPLCPLPDSMTGTEQVQEHNACHVGWYWWSCFPGCLPDSDAVGPFATEDEALADAREGIEDEDEGGA